MTVQQVQELLVDLTATEQLKIARWLIDTALAQDNLVGPTNEGVSSKQTEAERSKNDSPANGLSTQNIPSDVQQTDAIAREKQAFRSMHHMLWSQHPEEHVAIHKGQLVDHDVDGVALSRRIYVQYPHEFVLIRKVEPQPEKTLRFRSPRFTQPQNKEG